MVGGKTSKGVYEGEGPLKLPAAIQRYTKSHVQLEGKSEDNHHKKVDRIEDNELQRTRMVDLRKTSSWEAAIVPKHDSNKTVNTTTALPWQRVEAAQAEDMPKRNSMPEAPAALPGKQTASRPQGKKRKAEEPEHSLVTELKGAAEDYMTYQNDHYPQILREVHQSLVDRQKQSFDVSTELLKDFNKKLSIVQSPLGDEQLHITMKKGTPQETSLYASLGERIEEFHQRARRQLHELHELLKKRGNIVKQIDAVQKALDDPAENGYAQQVEKLKREYSDKRREAVDRYEERLQDIITRAKDMENSFSSAIDKRTRKTEEFIKVMENDEE